MSCAPSGERRAGAGGDQVGWAGSPLSKDIDTAAWSYSSCEPIAKAREINNILYALRVPLPRRHIVARLPAHGLNAATGAQSPQRQRSIVAKKRSQAQVVAWRRDIHEHPEPGIAKHAGEDRGRVI